MIVTDPRPGQRQPAPEATAAILTQGVRHVYRARNEVVPALASTDLAAAPGQLVAILGPSGCGKSTLLRIVGGLLAPSAGRVWLAGHEPALARQQRAIGWLAQDDGLFPWRTVADNVALPLEVGRRRAADRRPVAEMLAAVGLADSARRFPHELSGGMRQRAALARALVAQPPFLLLDEPFAHVDELTRERLGVLLLQLRAASRPTTLLVTHNANEAVRLADRAIVLSARPGAIIADVPIDLEHPRRDDQPGFGACVQLLKGILLADGEAG